MSDIASLLGGISQSIQSCPHCAYQFAVVEIVQSMSHGNLIPYPAVGSPGYCTHCGHSMKRKFIKQLTDGQQTRAPRRFAANKRYSTQEVVDILGYKSRDWLMEARAMGQLPFQEIGPRITYLGADLLRWVKGMKAKL
jgi:hypothetical protein